MTYNQLITLFRNIATAHKQIESFATGELWEVEGNIKPGIIYPMLFAVPVSSVTLEKVKIRTFTLLVFGQVKKDKSDEQEILSDCEQILDDVIKILLNESDDYDLIGEPQQIPFKEDMGDWVAGWRADIQIETAFASNYCDLPSDTFLSPAAAGNFAYIINQNGQTIATVLAGQTYTVEQLQILIQTLTDPAPVTIIQTLT